MDADRRSRDAMVEALASAKRAKAARMIERLTVAQLREALALLGQPADGKKGRANRAPPGSRRTQPRGSQRDCAHCGRGRGGLPGGGFQPRRAGESHRTGRHRAVPARGPGGAASRCRRAGPVPGEEAAEDVPLRQLVGPGLSWDEQRERDLGEWLLALIVRASKEGEAAVFAQAQVWAGGGLRVASLADAAQILQQISKPFLNWTGKAERHEGSTSWPATVGSSQRRTA